VLPYPLISPDCSHKPMLSRFQSQELDQKIAETWKHIQTERKILEATQLLRQATSNQDVLRRNDAKIRETERSLAYFEDTLRELQERKRQRDDPSRFPGEVPQVGQSPSTSCLSALIYSRFLGTTQGIRSFSREIPGLPRSGIPGRSSKSRRADKGQAIHQSRLNQSGYSIHAKEDIQNATPTPI
jgi:type II secretory pathway component PulJ